ncbi:TIGR04255 family protein [Micromonospora sp. WMMD710]|uniref:TIGR04255 family protein n=1 Tax=Micromonospora sp. WMMD710 TaxID=3016085 RepID=UPI002417D0E8|nr:TIGR04255 family protein [Micromonospora sp. WMMD710]MDG4756406.1 TIGR04255 family protein [Micromonospora sp. WMMD710]
MDLEADSAPGPVYRHDPIVEAIVELVFEPGPEWNITIPGRLYDGLRDTYPDPPKQREILEAGLSSEDDEKVGNAFTVSRKGTRVVFGNDNKLLMVGPDVLSVHSLRPYEGWQRLLPRIVGALDSYVAIARPSGVRKLSLRYINRINIPEDSFSLTEYFTITQGLPDAFPSRMTAFIDRMELAYEDIPAKIIFTWATTQPSSPGQSSFLLDLDLHWNEKCSVDEAVQHLVDLRQRERDAFESVINNRLREMFNAD